MYVDIWFQNFNIMLWDSDEIFFTIGSWELIPSKVICLRKSHQYYAYSSFSIVFCGPSHQLVSGTQPN